MFLISDERQLRRGFFKEDFVHNHVVIFYWNVNVIVNLYSDALSHSASHALSARVLMKQMRLKYRSWRC